MALVFRSRLAEDEGHVVPAETERVRQHESGARGLPAFADMLDRALWIRIVEIVRWRQQTTPQRVDTHRCFDDARGAQHVPGDAFGGTHRRRALTEDAPDRLRLSDIAQFGTGRVSV